MRHSLFLATLMGITLFVSQLQAQIVLDEVMSKDEQQKTGVANLSRAQKLALEAWLNKNFVLKQTTQAPQAQLYLSINIDNGRELQLSDNSIWEISPSDTQTSAVWITPFPVKIESSSNPNFPYRIINLNSGASVQARPVSGTATASPSQYPMQMPSP